MLWEAWAYHIGYELTLAEFNGVGGTTDNSVVELIGFENFDPLPIGGEDITPFNPLTLTLLFFNQNPVDLAILEYTNPLKHATFTHRI